MDYTDCSLLVARNAVSDEAIEAAFLMGSHTNGRLLARVPPANPTALGRRTERGDGVSLRFFSACELGD